MGSSRFWLKVADEESKNIPHEFPRYHWLKATGSEWIQLLPLVGTLSLLAYVTIQAFKSKPPPKDARVNLKIQKESSKVVNMVDIEELGDKVSYCRCWRSKRFPICDGSHNKHNEETNDNVGPLVLKRKEPLAAK